MRWTSAKIENRQSVTPFRGESPPVECSTISHEVPEFPVAEAITSEFPWNAARTVAGYPRGIMSGMAMTRTDWEVGNNGIELY
jgi:hypothetical protein